LAWNRQRTIRIYKLKLEAPLTLESYDFDLFFFLPFFLCGRLGDGEFVLLVVGLEAIPTLGV
jgi:hypothetical protein